MAAFLASHGTWLPRGEASSLPPGTRGWTVPLLPAHLGSLHVYEQREVQPGRSPHCHNCRVVGWAHHPVTCATYHFVVHADTPVEGDQCAGCGARTRGEDGGRDGQCPECGTAAACTAPDVLSITRHRLHGVLHANGFGHLLRICGREAGSAHLSGSSLLALWDSLCTLLRARLVTVEDVSTKSGLPLRVLHTLAHGSTWYGARGYAFGRGGFGISRHAFKRASDTMHKFSLGVLRADLRAMAPDADDGGLGDLVGAYDACMAAAHAILLASRGQTLKHGARKRRVATLGELITLVLAFCAGQGAATAVSLVAATTGDGDGNPAQPVDWATAQRLASEAAASEAGKPAQASAAKKKRKRPPTQGGAKATPATRGAPPAKNKATKKVSATASASASKPASGGGVQPKKCRWSAARVATATSACVATIQALCAQAPGTWMSRTAIRDGTRHAVGDLGLLDHALSQVEGVPVGPAHCVLRRASGAHGASGEFCIGQAPAGGERQPAAPVAKAPSKSHKKKQRPAGQKAAAPQQPHNPAAQRVGPWVGPTREEARAQLQLVYSHLLEMYWPRQAPGSATGGGDQGMVDGEQPPGEAAPGLASGRNHHSSTPPGLALVTAAQVVHDTKLFVKDFQGDTPLGVLAPPHSHLQRIAVIPALDGAARAPSDAGWAGGKPNRRREPPSELLLLPSTASVAELKLVATDTFQALYPCLGSEYVFHTVEGLALVGDRARVQLKPAPPPKPGAGAAAGGGPPPVTWEAVRLTGSYGTGPDAAARAASLATSPLRYQGGVETWQVRCACGVVDDDGERMFECSACGVWKHTRCEGLPDEGDVPEGHTCQACADKATRARARADTGKGTKRRR